jgi:hypothetical protein
MALRDNDAEMERCMRIAPPAQDALVRTIDLTHITNSYVNEHTLEVADETGRTGRLMLDCPGLKDARTFRWLRRLSEFRQVHRDRRKRQHLHVQGPSPLPAGALFARAGVVVDDGPFAA